MEARQYSRLLPIAKVNFEETEGGLDLAQVLGTIRRRAFLITGITVAVASAAVLKALTDTPVYQAKFELLTEPVSFETQVISSTNPETLSSRQDIVAVELDEAQLKTLKSPGILSPVIKELQAKYPELSYDSLFHHLAIEANKENSVLEVTYHNDDLQQVEDVLESIAQAYLEYSLETRQADISRGADFLEEQLPLLRSRVEALQERLQKLRQESNLIEPATQAQQLSGQIGNFVQQRLEVQAQLNEAQLLAANLQQELAQQPIELAAASALSNPRYQELLNQLLAIDAQIATESALFLESSPEIQILKDQRQRLLPLLRKEGQRIQREVASRVQELQIRDRALNQTVDRLHQQSKQLSIVTRKYTDLQRELEIATENLNQFIAKREALRIDAAQREIPWEILIPPTEPVATTNSLPRNLSLGTLLGLLLGTAAALGLDKLGNVIHTLKEVKETTQLPLLGIVPANKVLESSLTDRAALTSSNQDIDVKHNDGSRPEDLFSVVEAFRSLYTNIRLLNPDEPINSLTISSAMPEEGKTTVAIHLAQAAAAMGRRVLLVDTDLRSPQLHSRMGISNVLGLTDILSKENLDFDNVIQRVSLEDKLFVLTSGAVPPDPSRLLASVKMQNLMENLQATFDLVIYDAPILTGLADPHLLAAATNGIVLVTGLGKLKRSLLEQALEQIKISRTPILGVVANRAKDLPLGYYKYYGIETQSIQSEPYLSQATHQLSDQQHQVAP